MHGNVKSRKIIYEGKIVRLRVDEIELPGGGTAAREVVEHGGGVAILALWEGKILMVRQYRHAAGQELLELPAGTLEPGEDPAECAARELEEETGYRPGRVESLGRFYVTPGYVDEMIYLYMAEDLTPTAQNLDRDEFLDVVPVTPEDAFDACRDGRIIDAKTALGILLLKNRF